MLTPTMKGKINELIRNAYNSQNLINTLKWYLKRDFDCRNLEDFAMGYFFGAFMSISRAIVEYEKHNMILKRQKKEIKSHHPREHKKESQKNEWLFDKPGNGRYKLYTPYINRTKSTNHMTFIRAMVK